MHLHAIHHVPFEGPGRVADWAAARGFSHSRTWQHQGDPLPDLDSVDLLLVTGGPMSVGDEAEYPWLLPEKALIREALRRGIPTLGICLGAQLIAEVLGARVAAMGHKEIGWFPLRRTAAVSQCPWLAPLPDPLLALHWHGDQFDLPQGAIRLWESDLCPHQGFVHGSALALQFHLEMSPETLGALLHHARHEITANTPGIQGGPELLGNPIAFADTQKALFELLDGWWASQN